MPDALTYAKQIAYSSEAVLMFTYQMAKLHRFLTGSYVEAGVGAGAQLIAMMAGCSWKQVIGFDSFQGIPLPSNRDDQMPGIRKLSSWEQKSLPDPGKQALETSGATSHSYDNVVDNIKKSGVKGNYSLVPGWFEEVLPTYHIEEISLLRLDGDLYNSTFVCLQHLFPKCHNLACIIIDDWTLQGCQDACKEYFELIGYTPQYQYLDGTAYFFK